MPYVIAKGKPGEETYFCVKHSGHFYESPFAVDAVKFHDYAAGLECSGTHVRTRNSEEWRVIKLKDRCGRTR